MKETYSGKLNEVAKRLGINNEYLVTDAYRLMTNSTGMNPEDSLRMIMISGANSDSVKEFYRHISLNEIINLFLACQLFNRHYRENSLEALTGLSPEEVDRYHAMIREALRAELGPISMSASDWIFDLFAGRMAIIKD